MGTPEIKREAKRYMDRESTASYLGVSVRTVDKWLSGGRLRAVKAGRRTLVDKFDADRMYAGFKKAEPASAG